MLAFCTSTTLAFFQFLKYSLFLPQKGFCTSYSLEQSSLTLFVQLTFIHLSDQCQVPQGSLLSSVGLGQFSLLNRLFLNHVSVVALISYQKYLCMFLISRLMSLSPTCLEASLGQGPCPHFAHHRFSRSQQNPGSQQALSNN